MRNLFMEDGVDMGRQLEILSSDSASEIRDAVAGRYVCPFCGAVREQAEGACPRCTMESTAATRQATKSRIGPWYVLQTRNPAAPGMKFETLLTFVQKGRVKARSIVRGPTTHQLWRFAAHVKGLSREFGVCYSCGEGIEKTANLCPHCNRLQDAPVNPDAFLESQETDARPATGGSQPVYREIGATPLVAEDIVAPEEGAHAKMEAADPKPLPAGAAPPAGAMKKGADGFLTAADLAAAFKLDFQEPKGRRNKKTPVAPIGMNREQSRVGRPVYRRKRRWFRTVLLLLLLGAVGAFAYQYRKDAAFQARADHWLVIATDSSKQALDWSKQKWADAKKSWNKPAVAQPVSSPKYPQGTPLIIMPQRNGDASSANSTTQPQTPAPTVKPSPWDQIYGQPTNDSPTPPASHAASASAKLSDDAANDAGSVSIEPPKTPAHDGGFDDVRSLYGAALDAEGQGDYATAVKKFEQIKAYPRELWPRDLDLRLKLARAQLQ